MTTSHERDQLLRRLRKIREVVEEGFSPETAAPGFPGTAPSTGQCAAVAVVTRELLGGEFVSTNLQGHSHWFNRLLIGSAEIDVDLTGDQFGYRDVQFSQAGELYNDTRIRSPDDVTEETVRRAIRLASQAGLSDVAQRLREWDKAVAEQE